MVSKVKIIAELANSHEGNEERLFRSIDALIASKIGAVKFQILRADDLYEPGHERYGLFERLQFPDAVWLTCFERLRAAGVDIYCDIFAERGADFCANAGIRKIKIHSSDALNEDFVRHVAELRFDEILVGVGGLTAFEISHLIRVLRDHGADNLVLMHGQQSYPSDLAGNNVGKIAWLARHFGRACAIGYADHSAGYSQDAMILPVVAALHGAIYLEKHVTLDIAEKGVDHESATNIADMRQFETSLNAYVAAAQSTDFNLPPAERNYRAQAVKQPVLDDVSGQIVFRRTQSEQAAIPRGFSARQLAGKLTPEKPVYRHFLAVVIVRLKSQRLPRKAFSLLGEKSVLETLIDNIKSSGIFDGVVIATTADSSDDEIAALANRIGVPVYRGPRDDVTARIASAVDHYETVTGSIVSHLARMTGDNPFLIAEVHDGIRAALMEEDYDYIRIELSAPVGLNAEYFNAAFFRTFARSLIENHLSEYITYFVNNHRAEIHMKEISLPGFSDSRGRYTVDYPEDLDFCRKFANFLIEDGYKRPTVCAVAEFERSIRPDEFFNLEQKRPSEGSYGIDWGKSLAPALARPSSSSSED